MNFINFALLAITIIAITTPNMYGYIDPGTGSYIIQILIAGGAAGLYTIKIYWKSIKLFLTTLFSSKK